MPTAKKISVAFGICKECEYEGNCDRNKEKILECNMAVIDYFCDFKRGVNIYPYKGGWRSQANWFCSLFSKLTGEVNRLEQKSIDEAMKK